MFPKKIDFYRIFLYFFLCGFIGWIIETTFIFFETGDLMARGLLFVGRKLSYYFDFLTNIKFIREIPLIWGLPLIEIYGFGGIIIFTTMEKFKNKKWQLFFIGTILMTSLELTTSYFIEYFFHQTLWDYSTEFLNFQGRICLRNSIIWGLLSVFSIKHLKPKIDKVYKKEEHLKKFKKIIIALAAYTFMCILLKIFIFNF